MQTKTVDVHEAQTHLVELLSLVSAGTEVILTAGNTPLARIVPMVGALTPRVAGLHPGAIRTREDFDVPLPEEFWTGAP
jgi:antitoxin (DNA-binding transcriptional repressor) of toxin-antitoxin stability system